MRGCCEDTDVVISALGKSISLQDQSKGSFHDIDYMANYNLLQEARAANVRQFIYVSAFTAELHPELAYFKAHADFSEALKRSKLPCTILQPTALFSAFDEVVAMARKGRIGSLGKGYQLTNPIYEGDVAKVAVAAIGRPSRIIPLGGKHVYSRLQLIKIACRAAGYEGSIPKVPPSLVETLLPLVKLFNRNLHDKLAFMVAVSKQDCIAPKVGDMSLEEYFKLHPRKAA
ncbi:MAG: NAD(P)H-binding protein [Hymenobacteraceae bacterium]|nr:NAD(P)H-binding protein [Hymenobacteraceae bacterium]